MWLLILLAASIASTVTHFSKRGSSRILILILWGATLMVLVDKLYSYAKSGSFIEVSEESAYLGLAMLVLALALWALAVSLRRLGGLLRR